MLGKIFSTKFTAEFRIQNICGQITCDTHILPFLTYLSIQTLLRLQIPVDTIKNICRSQ